MPSKQELGAAVKIEVATASACVVEPGDAKEQIEEIIKNIKELKSK